MEKPNLLSPVASDQCVHIASQVAKRRGPSERGARALLVPVLLSPYRWFANIVALREKRETPFLAVFSVILFVSFARSELEILTTLSARYSMLPILNNIAFYLLSAYAYAAMSCWLTSRPLARVAGVVMLGVFMGVFPPVLDAVFWGFNTGYYSYVYGLEGWHWSLVNPSYYSPGEAVTLWVLALSLAFYVWESTRNVLRGIVALLASYATVVALAVGPSTLALQLANHASPLPAGSSLFVLTLVQITIAQGLYLLIRRRLAARLAKRLVHAAPFVALTFLGSAVSEYFSSSALTPNDRLRFSCFVAWLVLNLCVVALVQNDACDARKEAGVDPTATYEDAQFFTAVGLLLTGTVMIALPGLGLPMAIFLCGWTVYSFDFYRAKRFFPSNYKIEGIGAWASFVLGGSAQLSLASVRKVSPPFIVAGFLVFGGWSLFSAIKDYKDIRSDRRAGNQTLYVLALKQGIKLRKVHRALRMALLLLVPVPACALASTGVDWKILAAVTVSTSGAFYWVLGGPPRKQTVLRFFWVATAYLLALVAVIEHAIARG